MGNEMATTTVRFVFSSGEQVSVEAYGQLNILAHAQIAERELQSRCGGHCECSTCRVVLVAGRLSPMQEEERKLLARVGVDDPRTRLACQAFPEPSEGGIVLEVPTKKLADARHKENRRR